MEKVKANFHNLKQAIKSDYVYQNGLASTYFWLKYAGGKMTIIESNDNDVEPVEVDRLIIAVS